MFSGKAFRFNQFGKGGRCNFLSDFLFIRRLKVAIGRVSLVGCNRLTVTLSLNSIKLNAMMYAILLMMMMYGMDSTAALEPEVNCRQYILAGEYASERARYAADLVEGVWELKTDRLSGSQGQIIFHEFGMADEIITMTDGTMEYDRVHWTLEEYSGAVFLVVTQPGKGGRTNLYRMQPNCEGIDLTDAASLERIHMVYTGSKLQAVSNMAHYLTGAWKSDAYPFDIATSMEECGAFEEMKGAFFQFSFWQDGTYVKEWGNAGQAFREKGYWDITADGRYLLMHSMDIDGVQTLRTDVARIVEMGQGSFTVEQRLEAAYPADMFCTKVKHFRFNRW